MRAFIDTNVIVDVVAKREPFFADSQAILALCAISKVGIGPRKPISTLLPNWKPCSAPLA